MAAVLSDVEEVASVTAVWPEPFPVSLSLPVVEVSAVGEAEELAVSVSVGAAACAAVEVAGSMVVCVNRLNRLVFPAPPTPTAGTAPFSVPLPVCVADGLRLDAVSVASAAFAGSVGACRLQGDLGVKERPLTT